MNYDDREKVLSFLSLSSPASVATVCCVEGVVCLDSLYPEFFEKPELDKTNKYIWTKTLPLPKPPNKEPINH